MMGRVGNRGDPRIVRAWSHWALCFSGLPTAALTDEVVVRLIMLAFVCLMPLIGAVAYPAVQAAEPAWVGAISMTAFALIIALLATLWTRAGQGQRVARRLGWRYCLLVLVGCAIPTTLAALFLFEGAQAISLAGTWAVVVELALLQFLSGLASSAAPRNTLLGFRTPQTLATDAAWTAANQRWGRRLMWASPLALLGVMTGVWAPIVAMLPGLLVGGAFLLTDSR